MDAVYLALAALLWALAWGLARGCSRLGPPGAKR
jgi:hypothetical protein